MVSVEVLEVLLAAEAHQEVDVAASVEAVADSVVEEVRECNSNKNRLQPGSS